MSKENAIYISRPQFFQLAKWMEANKAIMGLDAVTLAKRAATELGFPISKHTVYQTRSDLGLSPRAAKKFEMKQEDFSAAIQTLATEISDLRKELGLRVSASLQGLAE